MTATGTLPTSSISIALAVVVNTAAVPCRAVAIGVGGLTTATDAEEVEAVAAGVNAAVGAAVLAIAVIDVVVGGVSEFAVGSEAVEETVTVPGQSSESRSLRVLR